MKCACGQYDVPSDLVPAQLRDGVYHMAPQMTPEGKPLLCEIASLRAEVARLRQEVLAEEYVHGDTRALLVKEGAAVKRLEREIARLTEERDAVLESTALGRMTARAELAEAEFDCLRALADRLAEALRELSGAVTVDNHLVASVMPHARAALREWEECKK